MLFKKRCSAQSPESLCCKERNVQFRAGCGIFLHFSAIFPVFPYFAIALFLIIWHTPAVRADFAQVQDAEVAVSLLKRPVPTLS